ncbi:MarR family winged helix-turn-helix transcriptional regulator [Brochothrix campestris]|uniref:HTH-type transcriptional regulator SarZ n=1 Tax=Brochothrix campestris FSL F6-1037 TaxID=1265861 RepID=W7D2V9_9LIST|nr:MarR family winged helix-turn-helix transcriptional regulator [Brochothrix campestris]EUJ39638.1 MarR family transcriptional regulator [Brochothrix campestris FSL F6-1037]
MDSSLSSDFQSTPNESTGLSFIKVYNLWHKLIKDELKTVNLTHPQFTVLASLGYLSQRNKEVSQVDISKQADIDVMTVSTIIRNLEKTKLLFRQESSVDTRAKSIMLTEEGRVVLSKALPLVEGIDNVFFGNLETDKQCFNSLLLKLIESNSSKG